MSMVLTAPPDDVFDGSAPVIIVGRVDWEPTPTIAPSKISRRGKRYGGSLCYSLLIIGIMLTVTVVPGLIMIWSHPTGKVAQFLVDLPFTGVIAYLLLSLFFLSYKGWKTLASIVAITAVATGAAGLILHFIFNG